MNKFKLLSYALTAAALSGMATSCGEDTLGKDTVLTRFDLSGSDGLTVFGDAASRAVDGEFASAGAFKLDADGNISAIGVFVDEDGKETRSGMSVVPANVYRLTENYLYFQWCSYFDEDGDPVEATDIYRHLIVRRDNGLIFSASDLPFAPEPIASSFLEDSKGRLLCSHYTFSPDNPGRVGRVTLSAGYGKWEQLSTDGSPISYSDYPKVFEFDGGAVATASSFPSINAQWNGADLRGGGTSCVGVIYPNGGYDNFGEKYRNDCYYVILEKGILEFGYADAFTPRVRYISVGSSYGQSQVEVLDCTGQPAYNASTWYETADKVIVKVFDYMEDGYHYIVYDKQGKRFSELASDHAASNDNIELWKENRCDDGRFYGIVRENGKVSKVICLDPSSLSITTKDVNIANEIDITTYACDYRKATAQLTGTRRSDGWKVAISLDMKTGSYKVVYSDPKRPVIALIPLN